MAAAAGRLRSRFPVLSAVLLSLPALAALSNEEVQRLAAGLAACGSTLTSFTLRNEESDKYRAPVIQCRQRGEALPLVDPLYQLFSAHPAALTLRLSHLLYGLPGLTSLDLGGLVDLLGHPQRWCCEYHCERRPCGFPEVFLIYAQLGGLSRLTSLRLVCTFVGGGLGLLAPSVERLAPSLRHLAIVAANSSYDHEFDADDDQPKAMPDVGYLGRLTSLETLELSVAAGSNFLAANQHDVGRPPRWLASLTRLTRLEAEGCVFSSGRDAAVLAGLPRLRGLSLSGFWHPEDVDLSAVAGVTRLKCRTSWCDLYALLSTFPDLAEADFGLSGRHPSAPAVPAHLGRKLRRLTARVYLPLSGSSGCDELRLLLTGLPALRQLHVASGSIGGAQLPPLLHAAPALEELTLSGDLAGLSDDALASCPAFPSLRALALIDDGGRGGALDKRPAVPLAGLSSSGLLALGRAFPGLTRLSLGEGVLPERRRAWWEGLRRGIAATGFCSDASLLVAVRRVLRREAARLAQEATP